MHADLHNVVVCVRVCECLHMYIYVCVHVGVNELAREGERKKTKKERE